MSKADPKLAACPTWPNAGSGARQQEAHRRLQAEQVPVALPRVHLHSKAPRVTEPLGGASGAGDRREAHDHVCAFAKAGENVCKGEVRDVLCDLRMWPAALWLAL